MKPTINRRLLGVLFLNSILAACGSSSSSSNSPMTLPFPDLENLNLILAIEPFDLNGDGRMDAIIAASEDYEGNARLVALINTGKGLERDDSYFPEEIFHSGLKPLDAFYMADINGDGHLDIVPYYAIGMGAEDSEKMPILVWDATEKHFKPMPEKTQPISAVPIHLNDDEHIDLLQPYWSGKWQQQLTSLANGELTWETPTPAFDSPPKSAAFRYYPIVMDINNDGRDDLIYAGPLWEDGWVNKKVPLTVMLNEADGWKEANHNDLFTGDKAEFTHARIMKVADFNGDGLPDIFIANHGYDIAPHSGEYNAILINNGNGFTVDTSSAAVNYRGFTHALAVGDINNDGHIDVVVADITGSDVDDNYKVRVLTNDGKGNFSVKKVKTSSGFTAAALIDVNNDGHVDLVLGGMDKNNKSTIILNDGKGTF